MSEDAAHLAGRASGWHFWIDRGGTFTDVVARDPAGRIASMKLLSEDPARYEDAAVEAVRRFLAGQPDGERHVAAVRMGTTVATNALLERRGEPTALVVTAGLRDVLRIGTQQRPDIFALDIRLPEMLYTHVVEANERMSAAGEVVAPLDEERLAVDLEAVRRRGIDSVAIVLMHGYRYPEHERRAGGVAQRLGFRQISMSHATLPLMKIVPRGDTTLVDAYLSPVLRRYVGRFRRGLAELGADRAHVLFMQSHGGLADAGFFRGKDSILSGPAGGVIGMSRAAAAAGFPRVLGFDMGGTSTDVSLYAGELERTSDETVAGVRVAAPMLRIHTVAAGGGSIVAFASGRLQVGPESAGADPGPACYRKGGPATITDANVLLGRIQPDFFPRTFGPDATEPLDVEAVRRRLDAVAAEVAAATGVPQSAAGIAAGALRIAVERMANAIRRISVERGHDVTEFALASFGGAAGQHACQVADALGIDTIFTHSLAGVLSAYGMGLADLRTLRQRSVEQHLDDDAAAAIDRTVAALALEAVHELEAQGAPSGAVSVAARAGLKAAGSDTTLPIAWSAELEPAAAAAAFREAHRRHFGFDPPAAAIVAEWVEVEAVAAAAAPRESEPLAAPAGPPSPVAVRDVWFDGAPVATPVWDRDGLAPGTAIEGPALIVEPNATTVVERGWRARVDGHGHVVMQRVVPRAGRERLGTEADPVMLEVFNNLFMHIAEQMGLVLEHTAHSVNIKERLDFSCALFDPGGDLIANAPHVPVHLGSMGDSVRSVLDAFRDDMAPGDVFVLNAPYQGGTHLPDITVVTPVWIDGAIGTRPDFVVASRAHHADIGGISPGSMPPDSRHIDEEGVVIAPRKIVTGGRLLREDVRRLLSRGPHPARNPEQNLADLEAQIAANARGAAELGKVVARYGRDVVHAYMGHVKANAEDSVRAALDGLRDGRWVTELDGGERIEVAVRIDRDRREADIDFTGTSPTSAGNLNAPASIARAAVLYVFRTLVRQNIPLNAGCLKPLRIQLPTDSLVNPRYPAAVVAGNVETSQCVTDALLAALGASASSQGTMNNFTFGDARRQYYETLCGGAGAGPGFDGASAVHTHMTNSRLTDPEVLEWRYPVRVRRFEVRAGSGGGGARRGGNGIVRDLEFLEPMHVAILSNRRVVPPFGLAGGRNGAPGRNLCVRADGRVETLGPTASTELASGDRFVVETPGGGGYGEPD